ncbi:MAG TPA: hypothetical protein VGP41_15345 [Candidatus Lustribacter sp.]|nr:hypothetical protein [Candidatus Lustribacter sp.]
MSDNRSGLAAYLRALWAIAAAVILTFFAMQIFYAPKITLPYKIGLIVAIVVIGVAGITALLTPEPDEPQPSQRLYTADEVAALVAAVQAGRLVAAAPAVCKFCAGADPELTGVDGTHYHKRCFQNAYLSGKT